VVRLTSGTAQRPAALMRTETDFDVSLAVTSSGFRSPFRRKWTTPKHPRDRGTVSSMRGTIGEGM
jgi:hypothetical protein